MVGQYDHKHIAVKLVQPIPTRMVFDVCEFRLSNETSVCGCGIMSLLMSDIILVCRTRRLVLSMTDQSILPL
jgi:hypothetical protein